MASYDELDVLVEKLKRSAIDAWMHAGGWSRSDDRYSEWLPGEISDTHHYVTRPGADGEGGGKWSSDSIYFGIDIFGTVDRETKKFREKFAEIRKRIDDAVEPWKDIPDPETIDEVVESCRQVMRDLSPGASSDEGVLTGASQLCADIQLIDANLNGLEGEIFAAFKRTFLIRLSTVIGGFHSMMIISGGHATAQRELWKSARNDVASILDETQKALDRAACGNSRDWTMLWTVVGTAARGVALFFRPRGWSVAWLTWGLSSRRSLPSPLT